MTVHLSARPREGRAMPLRVGLVGAGRAAALHAAALTSCGAIIAGVGDPNHAAAEKLSREVGAPAYSDYRNLLDNPAIDAVSIATPHHLHETGIIAALSAGKHVFAEKPLTTDLESARRIIAALEGTGLTLMVNHQLLFHDAVQQAQALIVAHEIGRPRVAVAEVSGWLDIPRGDFRLRREHAGGGIWIDAGLHVLYVLEALLGPFSEARGLSARVPSRLGGEDAFAAMGRFQGGTVATAAISVSDRNPQSDDKWPAGWVERIDIRGDNGRIALEILPVGRLRYSVGAERERDVRVSTDLAHAFQASAAEFICAIHERRPPAVEATDALRVLTVALQAYEGSQ